MFIDKREDWFNIKNLAIVFSLFLCSFITNRAITAEIKPTSYNEQSIKESITLNNIEIDKSNTQCLFEPLSRFGQLALDADHKKTRLTDSQYTQLFNALKDNNDKFLSTSSGLAKYVTEDAKLENVTNTQELKKKVVDFAIGTRVLIDEKVKILIKDFLNNKKKNGTVAERSLYKNMSDEQFVVRLFKKRPLVFMNGDDLVRYRDGKITQSSRDTGEDFIRNKNDIKRLREYLSYDEMQIGALLSVSGGTFFINEGGLQNNGVKGEEGTFQREGILAGSVGCRFERPELMEYQHMVVSRNQNRSDKGYGVNSAILNHNFGPWEKFYGIDHFPTYDEVTQSSVDKTKFHKIQTYNDTLYLNLDVYKQRLRLSYEPFLRDMNKRAKQEGRKAYIRLTGLGLGVWALDKRKQTELMIEVVKVIISENNFKNISQIEFMWLSKDYNGLEEEENGVKICCNLTDYKGEKNTTASLLPAGHENDYYGVNYAWDSNSYPGNEKWIGLKSASMDPAVNHASLLGTLHNAEVNDFAFSETAIKSVQTAG